MRRWQPNPVALLGVGVALLAFVSLPFFSPDWLLFKANRIVLGESFGFFALSPLWAGVLLGLWCVAALASLLPLPGRAWWLSALASLGLVAGVLALAAGTEMLLRDTPPSARVSLQAGVWLMLLGVYIVYFAALGEMQGGRRQRWLMVAPGPLAAFALIALGLLGELGIARELEGQGGDFWAQAARHIALSGTSVLLAAVIGIPAAVWAARREEVARVVLPVAALLQTLPSLALFGLMLAPLARLGQEVSTGEALLFMVLAVALAWLFSLPARASGGRKPLRTVFAILTVLVALLPLALLAVMVAVSVNDLIEVVLTAGRAELSLWAGLEAPLSEIGIRGIGTAPALIALTLYAFLPIIRNTYTGIREAPGAAIEAGRGMGMSSGQILRRVELPLALPLIVEGLRASAVLTVGITTVAFLIGAGGLGTFIEQGIGQRVPDLILLGAIPIILLALLVDGLLRGVSLLLTSPGIRR